MSYYADTETPELMEIYDDLIDFHRTAPRAQDKASANIALVPVVEELTKRGVADVAVPVWTKEDAEQYKTERDQG